MEEGKIELRYCLDSVQDIQRHLLSKHEVKINKIELELCYQPFSPINNMSTF